MKLPKKLRKFCPHCKTYTEHSVSQVKKRAASPFSWGQRQFNRAMRGYGSQPRSEQKKFFKTAKKVTLLFKCSKCGKAHPGRGFRSKVVKFGE
ncbi:MAG: 50S ribosomal protein L44e [Candidatus Hadarchaeota archaeon]